MHNRSLLDQYQNHLDTQGFTKDPHQIQVIHLLQNLYDQFCQQTDHSQSRLGKLLANIYKRPTPEPIKGVYLWGKVGCGKTFLLNLFFEQLPIAGKQRLHFHRFMNNIHNQLNHINGQEEPLATVADTWSKQARLLYLDEFYVADIGDAMILAELIKHLFARGVILIASSNCHPQSLYTDGLQRERFLPAINLLMQYMEVVHLDSADDYRLYRLTHEGLYNVPPCAETETVMQNTFKQFSTSDISQNKIIEINGRSVQTMRNSANIIWFNFADICGNGRSVRDYLKITHRYPLVMVSGVPRFYDQDDSARRFINMIDTFYDNRIIFICSAEDTPDRLYQKGRLANDFQRTASRLNEMQSKSYLIQKDMSTYEKAY